MVAPNDFSSASKETLTEIIREAESYLAAQLSAGLAANARAMSLTGFLATATAVITGAAVNLLMTATPHTALGVICIGVSIAFLLSTWLAILAASPTRFWYVGNSPARWLQDIKEGKSLENSLSEMASFYSSMIDDNTECMALSNSRLTLAMTIAWTALCVGGMMIVAGWEAGVL